jgi:hypothetical protein
MTGVRQIKMSEMARRIGAFFESTDAAFAFAFTVLLACHLFLIWTLRLYPFVDLPDHLATATILRHYGEPTNLFAEYLTVNSLWLKPNLFHLLFCSSSFFPSVEWANKVFYCSYVFLLAISILLWVRRIGGEKWHALLAFTLLYNFNVSWGFMGFTISIPLLFILFYCVLNYFETGSLFWAAIIMVMFVFLFLVHALMAVFAISLYFICCVRRQQPPLRILGQALVSTAPVLVIILIWWNSRETSPAAGPGFILSLVRYYENIYFPTLFDRTRFFVFDNYFLYEGIWGYLVAIFFWMIIIVPAATSLFNLRQFLSLSDSSTGQGRELLLKMLIWSLLCFSFLPEEIFNFQILYPRFSAIFLLAAVIVGSVKVTGKTHSIAKIGISLVCIFHLILWSDYFRDFNRQNASFTKSFFPADSSRKILGGLMYDYKFRGKPVYAHFPSYYIIWTQGLGTFRIVDFVDFAPPLRRKDRLGSEIPIFNERPWLAPRDETSYLDVDYILTRGMDDERFRRYLQLFQLEGEADGKWFLYARKNPRLKDEDRRVKPKRSKSLTLTNGGWSASPTEPYPSADLHEENSRHAR